VNPIEREKPATVSKFKKPFISYSYLLLRFIPCYTNKAIDAFTSLMDIANIIKLRKIAERNVIHFVGRRKLYD
jgi:hypothetical protein